MDKKNLKLKERAKMKKYLLMASITDAILFCNAIVLQAQASGTEVVTKVNNTSNSIYGLLKGVCLGIIVVVLAICGLILIAGTQKMKDAVKDNFYYIAIGVMVLFFAKEIVGYIEETFG